jgi:2-C-methyl-D-erythritol 4-phosphate cytidylyltransferase/2-C-methyl-D-erythritol 2,4-cyclodiphosphate synthase
MNTIALIVAAGSSVRFGGSIPKTYANLAGQSVLSYSLKIFGAHPAVDAVRVVIQEGHQLLYNQTLKSCGPNLKVLEPIRGGAERQESVRLGLESIASLNPHRVIIHDAARPLLTSDLIERVLVAIRGEATSVLGAIAAIQIPDTVKRATTDLPPNGQHLIDSTVDRRNLWRAQTPQAFDFKAIMAAHQSAKDDQHTDDAAVAEASGLSLALITGESENFKITNTEDLTRAEIMLSTRRGDIRVGNGFDTHRFEPGDHVILCGVPIPYDKSLQGHSDADVALHAVTDALLSAIGAGDIGIHFPPSDNRWRDEPSDTFVSYAAERLHERNGIIANIDVTIICESPLIAPHRESMQNRLAAMIGVDPMRVNVKGTTTERLGFTGRGEGISALATATVRLPFTQPNTCETR